MLQIIWSRRELLIASVLVMIRQRFAGATLGLTWLVLGPLLLLILYAVIYLVVFQVRPLDMDPPTYVLYIFSGLVPLMAFSQGLVQGTGSLAENSEILLNTIFPAELVPLRECAVVVVSLAIGLAITALFGAVLGKAAWTWLLIPFFLALLLLMLIGVVWVLSLVNLVFKDIQQLLSYVTIVLLVASPIAYTPSMLSPKLQTLIYLNPLAYFVIALQSLIVLGKLPPPSIIVGCVGFAIVSFVVGAWIFSRAKMLFLDYA
jgi:lipopolysaccharide transport system permease protein